MQRPQAHGLARHGDGQTPQSGRGRLAIDGLKHVHGGACGRDFAKIQRDRWRAVGKAHHGKSAAANAGGERIDDAEHQRGGDGCVDGIPAVLQDLNANLTGVGVVGCDGSVGKELRGRWFGGGALGQIRFVGRCCHGFQQRAVLILNGRPTLGHTGCEPPGR